MRFRDQLCAPFKCQTFSVTSLVSPLTTIAFALTDIHLNKEITKYHAKLNPDVGVGKLAGESRRYVIVEVP